MINEYFVASVDEPIAERKPVLVVAPSSEEAVQRYLVKVYAHDHEFRAWVLATDLAYSFIGQVCRAVKTPSSHRRAMYLSQLQPLVERYFRSAPELGRTFSRYLESGDKSVMTDHIFEFIAQAQANDFLAIRLDEIQTL